MRIISPRIRCTHYQLCLELNRDKLRKMIEFSVSTQEPGRQGQSRYQKWQVSSDR